MACLSHMHTNGCAPSMLQYEICKARSGQNIIWLSKFLAVTLDCLFRGKAKPCCIRDVIRQHNVISDEAPLTLQMLINIKLSLDHLGTKIQQDKEYFLQTDPEKVHADPQEKVKLDKFVREWLKSALNSDGASDIQEMLQQCRLQDAGFRYKVFFYSE